jgi:dTDP-4-amino-4,6-dideoxygalactose transaminase
MVPLIDLRAQYRSIKREVDDAVLAVLESGRYVLGEAVAAFEVDFARYAGARYGIAVNSGTSALHLALLAAGVAPGHEVITVPFTFVATVAAIEYTGARPVFVDIDPATGTIDVDRIAPAITPRTRAIVPVHLYGNPADMTAVREVADRHGLVVIEDAAQAHGAEHRGRRVGSLGHLGCFSFYPAKNLGAAGEGGLVTTDDAAYAEAIRELRDWGQDRKYHHARKGFNHRMDAIQGAILGVKLRHLEEWTTARRQHAARYDCLLGDRAAAKPAPDDRHVYHVYAIRSRRRDVLLGALSARDIQTGIHYPVPVHLQPAYANLGFRCGDFPAAEQMAREVLSLPMFPELTPEQVAFVATTVRECDG